MPAETVREPPPAHLLRDGIVTFVCRLLSLVTALGLSIATARYLGPAGRGSFALPTIDAAIATAMFVGLSSAMSYLLLNARAGRGAVRAVFIGAVPLVAAGSLLVIALGLLGHHLWATIFALASLPFAAVVSIAQGVCYGTHRTRLANYLGLSLTVVTLLGMLTGFLFVARNPNVAIGAWLISQGLVALAGLLVIARIVPELPHGPAPTRTAVIFAAKMGAVNLITLLNYRADVYIIALFTSPSVLGLYTLAVAGAEATQTVTQAVATTTAPHVGSLPLDRSRLLTARAARNNVALASIACIVIALVSPLLISALFGPLFVPIVGVLRILLVGVVAMSASGVLSNYFTLALGKPEQSMYISAAGAALSIALGLVLVPRLGINGAALSVATSYVLSATLYVWCFRHSAKVPLQHILFLQHADLHAYIDLATSTLGRLRRIIVLPEGPV